MRPQSSSLNLRPAMLAVACVMSACLDAPPTMDSTIDPSGNTVDSLVCVPTRPPPGDDPQGYLIHNCPTCCPAWGCGTNGAWLGGNLAFHELDASGKQFNSAGLRVAGFFDAQFN